MPRQKRSQKSAKQCLGANKGLHLKLERFLHHNSSKDQKKQFLRVWGVLLFLGILRPNSSKDSAKISLRSFFS